MFFLVVGMILVGIGLLLLTAKIMTYIKCTVVEISNWFRNENLLQPQKP